MIHDFYSDRNVINAANGENYFFLVYADSEVISGGLCEGRMTGLVIIYNFLII